MKRLNMTVEGQTEQTFAVAVLQPHLVPFDVMVCKPRLTGLHARRGGRIPTGGLLNTFTHALEDIRRWLKEDRSPDARFSMMVDLYGLPHDFPGHDQATGFADPYRNAETLEQSLAEELGDDRFVPYVQIHEFESLLLSAPAVFAERFEDRESAIEQLAAECSGFDSPERINEGQHTHPKARIMRHVNDYDALADGPELARLIGIDRIRSRCPHFNQWLAALEKLNG